MKITPLRIPAVKLLEPRVFGDNRGFFAESYRYSECRDHGITAIFVQDNLSRSATDALRGLHYQCMPGQAKLVRATAGRILDVAVDLRRGSPTFGQHVAEELSADNLRAMFVPVGFAHGFCVLDGPADVIYKVDTYYDPEREAGVRYDDPDLAIDWPIAQPLVSERDRNLPTLADAHFDFVL